MLKKVPMTKEDVIKELQSQSKNLEELFDLSETNNSLIKKKYIAVEEVEHIIRNSYITSKRRKEEVLNGRV